MGAIVDLIVGSLLLLIGLVIWGFVYASVCTAVIDTSTLSLVALIPMVLAAGFLIKGFLSAFT